MTTRTLKLAFVAAGAVLASQTFAGPGAETATAGPPANPPKATAPAATTTAAATIKPGLPAPVTRRFAAAGSVIVLVDGVVAEAAIATVQPPAPGFVYER